MPDDRELLDTGSSARLLANRSRARRPPTRPSWPPRSTTERRRRPEAKKPLRLPLLVRRRLRGRRHPVGRPGQRAAPPEPQLPELHRPQPGAERAPTGWAPTTSAGTCCPGSSSGPGSRSSSASSAWPSAWSSAAPPASSRATGAAASTSPSTPSRSSSWPSRPSWP